MSKIHLLSRPTVKYSVGVGIRLGKIIIIIDKIVINDTILL